MTPITYAATLCSRGIELTLKGNRLHVWPVGAYRHGLSDEERAYITEHREELKALVRGGLPETTVVWQPAKPAPTPPDPAVLARHGRDAQLREQNLDAWLVLHGNEPEAIAIRNQQSGADMLASLQRAARGWRGIFGGV